MTETVLWRRLDRPGHEVCRVAGDATGWTLAGTAVFSHEGAPCALAYRVVCDADWRTLAATVTGRVGAREVDLAVRADGAGRWWLGDAEQPVVAGCLDVDLGFSPSTNLLPIRRLGLAVGEPVEVVAAWLPFPALAFEPLRQRYRREDERTVRYESAGGAFVRTLDVRPSGLVMRYPGLWEAEAHVAG